MSIHPQAIVSPNAQLGSGVKVGPYSIIEEGTEIGDDCVIEAGAQIRKGSIIGRGCVIGAGAVLGSDPQFRGFDSSISSGIILHSGNVLREYVTVHRSTQEGAFTVVGSDNYLMVGTHIGHDSVVGDGNTLGNNVLLGGHVSLGSHCFLGGGSAFHQFVRIGDYAMSQGHSGFSQDLPPYLIGADINVIVGINAVGLKRSGFSPAERTEIKAAFREIYHGTNTIESILNDAEKRSGQNPAIDRFFAFFRESSKKGVCTRSSRRTSND